MPEISQHLDEPVEPETSSSLEAYLQARRARLQSEQTIDIPVPSWGNKLVAKYRGISWDEMRGDIVDTGKSSVREVTTAANLLLDASVDVYFLEPDGSIRSLGPWAQAYTQLGVTTPERPLTARQALMAPRCIFERDTQLMAHFGILQEWQQGAAEAQNEEGHLNDAEVDEQLRGESVSSVSSS